MLQKRVIKRRAGGRSPVAGLLTVLCLLALRVPVMAASSSEEALRTRVEQVYAALQQGNWARVEKYLTKESKPIFRGQQKQPVLAHRIESIKLDPGADTATVVVQIPNFGSPIPQLTTRPQTTRWRLVKGVWYLDFFRPDLNALQSPAGTPKLPPKLPSPPRIVPTELRFESTWAGFEVHRGEVKVARFPFTNVSNHNVTLELIKTGCDCVRMKTQQKEFKPGESAVLEFEFDPSYFQFNVVESFSTVVELKILPGGEEAMVTIAALLEPGAGPPSRP